MVDPATFAAMGLRLTPLLETAVPSRKQLALLREAVVLIIEQPDTTIVCLNSMRH
jgi:hypothetical protein